MQIVLLTLISTLVLWSPVGLQISDAGARFNRAVELQRAGSWKEAAAEYRQVLALVPNYAEAHANLGAVLVRLGSYDEAIAAYQKALQINPKLTPVLLNLGIAYYQAGQFANAIAPLESFLKSSPGNSQAEQLIGIALVELGRDAEAVAHLEPAVRDVPANVTALYSLGLAYLRLKRLELSGVIRQLNEMPEGIALAHLLRGQDYLEGAAFEKAATELTEASKIAPELPRVEFLMGLADYKLGRSPEALSHFERELSRSPGDFLTLYYLATVLEKEGDLDSARKRAQSAIEEEPESVEARTLLGSILFKQDKTADAAKMLEIAISKRPDYVEAHYLLGRTYQRMGRKEDAARQFADVDRLKAEDRDREKEPKPNHRDY